MLGKVVNSPQILIIEVSQICQTNFPRFVPNLKMTELRSNNASRKMLATFSSVSYFICQLYTTYRKVTLGGLDTCLKGQLVPDCVIHSATYGCIKTIEKFYCLKLRIISFSYNVHHPDSLLGGHGQFKIVENCEITDREMGKKSHVVGFIIGSMDMLSVLQ